MSGRDAVRMSEEDISGFLHDSLKVQVASLDDLGDLGDLGDIGREAVEKQVTKRIAVVIHPDQSLPGTIARWSDR